MKVTVRITSAILFLVGISFLGAARGEVRAVGGCDESAVVGAMAVPVTVSPPVVPSYVFEGHSKVDYRITGVPPGLERFLRNDVGQMDGRVESREALLRTLTRLLHLLGRNGFAFARLELMAVHRETGSTKEDVVTVEYRVEAGQKVHLHHLIVRGNRATKRHVVLRELRIRGGAPYDVDKVERVQRRLSRLGYFGEVAPPQVFVDSLGRGGLVVTVSEGSYNSFNGVMGYNPPATSTEGGYLTGLLDVGFGNLFGTGRRMRVYWEKKSRNTQELELVYYEPWVAGWPVNVEGSFHQKVQDTLYVNRKINVRAELPVTDNLSAWASAQHVTVLPDSAARMLLGISSSGTYAILAGFDYSNLANPLNPRKGVHYSTWIETGRKTIWNPAPGLTADQRASSSINRMAFDAALYMPIWSRTVVCLGIHGRRVTSTRGLPGIEEQFRLGGSTSIRGYREEEFRATSAGWSNLELRYLLGPSSRAYVFLDAGHVRWPQLGGGDGFTQTFARGLGFGVQMETKVGLIGLAYGLGVGDPLANGKVHFQLRNRF